MLAPPPATGVSRVDAPAWMGEERFFDVLRHMVETTDSENPVPGTLSFAEESARMSSWHLLKVYRKVFEREAGESDPELWALVTLEPEE
jgi:hypothetical protein